MFGKIVLAVSLVVTATPAMANGSMGREVSIIFVQPSREIRQMDELRSIRKNQVRQARQAEKSRLEDQRAANRRALEADKTYYKKLDQQRKAAKKK